MESETKQEILNAFGNQLRLRVCGICIENEKVLLAKHLYLGKKDYLWSPPGGGLHFAESAEQTLLREFKEETGLEIQVGRFIFAHEFLDVPFHAIELFFEVKIIGGELVKGIDPELSQQNQLIQSINFLSLDEIKQENPLNLHSVFRNIESISSILKKQGYFLSKN